MSLSLLCKVEMLIALTLQCYCRDSMKTHVYKDLLEQLIIGTQQLSALITH